MSIKKPNESDIHAISISRKPISIFNLPHDRLPLHRKAINQSWDDARQTDGDPESQSHRQDVEEAAAGMARSLDYDATGCLVALSRRPESGSELEETSVPRNSSIPNCSCDGVAFQLELAVFWVTPVVVNA